VARRRGHPSSVRAEPIPDRNRCGIARALQRTPPEGEIVARRPKTFGEETGAKAPLTVRMRRVPRLLVLAAAALAVPAGAASASGTTVGFVSVPSHIV
jgi:hypothetical protein